MTTTKHGHRCSRSAFGKVRFLGHKIQMFYRSLLNYQLLLSQQPTVALIFMMAISLFSFTSEVVGEKTKTCSTLTGNDFLNMSKCMQFS